MTVWVVLHVYDYEGSDIVSIHATEDGAKRAAAAKALPYYAHSQIEAYEVQE